ncbi:methyltransferase domain-containing protein, partial [Candidatus Woesearchaeota archaeon]|nr:methyltransferase domain-containing protein [Candidatus Woesearchaeota archaeon]
RQQHETWNKFSPGWKKWDSRVMKGFEPIGDALISAAGLRENSSAGFQILDVATGTGEPGLTAAKHLPKGKVIGIDISEAQIQVANGKAKASSIINFEGIVYDGKRIPFNDGAFDAVLCRHGIMFFPDIVEGIKEMVRVLKFSGKIALSSWGIKEKNPWQGVFGSVAKEILSLPPPDPELPHPFRCSDRFQLESFLRQSGIEPMAGYPKEIIGSFSFESPEQYFQFITEVSPATAKPMAEASEEQKKIIKEKVIEKARAFAKGDEILFPWSALVAAGIKPKA